MAETRFREVTLDHLKKVNPGRLTRLCSGPATSTKLVFVHGFWNGPPAYRQLLELFLDAGQDVYVFHFRSFLFSKDAERVSSDLASGLEMLLADEQSHLVLVGHSLGGILVRRATLLLYEAKPSHLARIDRLLLLSSTNRGFAPVRLFQSVLLKLVHLLPYTPPIMDGLRGSTWMTRLRIDWLETFGGVRIRPDFGRSAAADIVTHVPVGADVPPHPITVQLDGDRDRMVRPDDDDLELFEGSVIHRVMPGVGHLDFALQGLGSTADAGRQETETSVACEPEPEQKRQSLETLAGVIRDAVLGRLDPAGVRRGGPGFGLALGRAPRTPDAAGPEPEAGPPDGSLAGASPDAIGPPPSGWLGKGGEPASLNVVFMIHGIRDYGSWHPLLEDALEHRLASTPGFWRVVAIEYGFFSALQFLLPAQQSRLVHGFVDRYLNETTRCFRLMRQLGRFLPVRIHIAAHSNGSNILAQALDRDAEVSFSRIFLAGCVLRRDFWQRHPRRAFLVRNDCATRDWPVGVLCGYLGRLSVFGWWFLGTAGVDGFEGEVLIGEAGQGRKFVQNSFWLTGDHGAALEPVRIDSIADYLVTGQPGEGLTNADARSPMWPERFWFWLVFALVLGTVILLGIGLYFASHWIAVLLGIVLFLVAVGVIMGMLNF